MQLLNPLDDSLFPAKTASYTGTAGSTGTWDAGVEALLVWTTTAAFPVPFAVPKGTGGPWRVSAIQVASGGNVYAKPISGT